MAGKKKVFSKVVEQKELAGGIFDLWLETELAAKAVCGQFVGVYPKDKSHLLPRPISICEIDQEKGRIRLVYRIQGEGTKEFSSLKTGDEIQILGILGNGFPVEAGKGKRALLMGGGIGVPPILQLAKELEAESHVVLGYRNEELFLKEEFENYGKVSVATEDGSVGTKGNVMDAVKENGIEAEIIYACGPMPMLKAIKEYAAKAGIPAYISLEERMACGVGACLGCVCKTTKIDHHSHVDNARICTEGPVFLAEDIMI
ncbi:MAG: dihydroorotate dehydrogenase electron transfer subunit [Lachnospiraceae bacterium]|nr:dihydroorotate dehydrogenase electron transfer subunit [Lachnospiraceae bacterium]